MLRYEALKYFITGGNVDLCLYGEKRVKLIWNSGDKKRQVFCLITNFEIIMKDRDVSSVRHCVLGHTHSSFGRREYWMKGPIGGRKKIECLCKLQNSRKKQRHTIHKFVFLENNFYQQIDSSVTVYFAVNFQSKAKKPLCFLITFLSR